MHEPQQYDSPPVYSPPYSSASLSLYAPRSVHSPARSHQHPHHPQHHHQPDPGSYGLEDGARGYRPQLFHRWFSPPGFVKTFHAATVLMCFVIFACVASTLVWDMHGMGYGGGGYGVGGGVVGGGGPGYYGGSYGYASSYMTPHSAKSAMISMAAINFLAALGFLVGSFSRTRAARGRGFYLAVFVCDVILAVMQGIIDIIFVMGVNPMSQSSQSMLYNPMLMLCQNVQATPGLSASAGSGLQGGLFNQYLHHYCFMDPEEAVALVLGLMVVLALALAAYYAYKTRSKIWHHGKPNIYWDQPLVRTCQGPDVQDWVNHVGEGRSTQQAPTVVLSERAVPDLRGGNSAGARGNGTFGVYSHTGGYLSSDTDRRVPEPLYQNVGGGGSSEEEEDDSVRKPPQDEDRERGASPTGRSAAGSPHETVYTTGDEDLDQGERDHLYRLYPEITSEEQRRRVRGEFDSDLVRYKTLCSQMDDIGEQIHVLGVELDALPQGSMKYQGVAEEYSRLKDLKRSPNYQGMKKETRELRQKLRHIKRLVKDFDLHV